MACRAAVEWVDTRRFEDGEHAGGELTYQPGCTCGWSAEASDVEATAWRAALDHAVPGWREAPVLRLPEGEQTAKKQRDTRAKVAEAYSEVPADWPLLTLFGPCRDGQKQDRVDGVHTEHGCRGVVPGGRYDTSRGAAEVCACSCHDADVQLPSRCIRGCGRIAVKAGGRPVWEPYENAPAIYCARCWERLRDEQVLEVEVGRREWNDWSGRAWNYALGVMGGGGAWNRDPVDWLVRSRPRLAHRDVDERWHLDRIVGAAHDAGYERPKGWSDHDDDEWDEEPVPAPRPVVTVQVQGALF